MNRTREHELEAGIAMVSAIVVVVALLGIALTYASLSVGGYESSERDLAATRARIAAEEGLNLAIAELKTGVDLDGGGLGVINFTGGDGRQIVTRVTDLGGDLWQILSTGSVTRADTAAQVLVQLDAGPPIAANTRAAITARGPVTTTGSIEVDGRDWDFSGLFISAAGVPGISSMGAISVNGASQAGGSGVAPAGAPVPPAIEPTATWGNALDDDGDGLVDEEAYDGLDNDGDGQVDEDTNGYPQNPDAALSLAPGSLMAIAQARGTYFAAEADLNAWIAANGGSIPGGVIIYLDFPSWLPADLGNALNDPPSIIVHHQPGGNALMKNVHGQFRGLVLADFIEHINGDFMMLGGLQSFADEAYGNAFGNGNASVRYSSAVLGSLPSSQVGAKRARVLSWSRASQAMGVTP